MAQLFTKLCIAAGLLIAWPAAAQNESEPSGNTQQAQEPASPTFTFTDSTVDLPAGEGKGGDTLIVKISGKKLPSTEPEVKEEGLPATFTSTVTVLRLMKATADQQVWLLSAKVEGLTSKGSTTRYLTVSHGGASETLPYIVNNAYAAAFSWSVSAPTGLRLARDKDAAIPVKIHITGPVPAANVALGQSVLLEGDSLTPLELELCSNETGDCAEPAILDAKRVHNLYLRPRHGSATEPGSYAGTISLVAPEKPEVATFALALYVSSLCLKLWGLFAIALGVALAWLVTVGARNLISRKQLQRAVALLRERHSRLEQALDAAFPAGGVDPAQTRAVLVKLRTDLVEADESLPAAIPAPWQGEWDGKARFTQLVGQIDGQLDGVEVIVDQGLVPLSRLGLDNADVQAGVAAVDAKAGLAGTSTPQALAAEIRSELGKVQKKLDIIGDVGEEPSSPAKLQFEIRVLGALSWLFILTVTILAGALALLLPNKGFGRWDDYVTCLLWGFGLPIAGAQLSSLTASSVTTAFSVSKPSGA